MEGPQWTGPDRPDRPAVARPAVARPARTGPDYPCVGEFSQAWDRR